jgi:hypothetical protein
MSSIAWTRLSNESFLRSSRVSVDFRVVTRKLFYAFGDHSRLVASVYQCSCNANLTSRDLELPIPGSRSRTGVVGWCFTRI